MSVLHNVAEFHRSAHDIVLAHNQPPHLQPLLDHLVDRVRTKTAAAEAAGNHIEVLGPDFCREYPAVAGQWHADLITGVYGPTYALPNKDPEANRKAIVNGDLDVYIMLTNGKPTATACLVNTRDGRAELGRAASIGENGGIILDLRIIDWLSNAGTADKYHTLFTTLRTAPNRAVRESADDEPFTMKGGQAITSHWSKFPGVRVNGFGPLYYKHGALEQFAVASLSRHEADVNQHLYIHDSEHAAFVRDWHNHYDLDHPPINQFEDEHGPHTPNFAAHYPPPESGLTELVHADIVPTPNGNGLSLELGVKEAVRVGSPFAQVVVPLHRDTRHLQAYLTQEGFQVFGYQHADAVTPPALLFGRTRPDCEVVPTFWSEQGRPNPFWKSDGLHSAAETIAQRWQ
jgi:hypothetical protein